MHIISGGADIGSVPLDTLCREGVIVDLSDEMEDWTEIKPHHITDRVEVKKGDILLYNTGWHRYFNGGAEEDEERYYLRHPGGGRELAEWFVEMELAWTGMATGSGDHPMNTPIRHKRPDARKAFEAAVGRSVDEAYPEDDLFVMHRVPFGALAADELHPGVVRRAFSSGRATVTAYEFAAGASFPLHRHPAEQVTLVEDGQVRLTVGPEEHVLDAGAWSVVAGGVPHGITARALGVWYPYAEIDPIVTMWPSSRATMPGSSA